MGTPILAFPNYLHADSDYATVALSGGSWQSDLPLTNLLGTALHRGARSTNALVASTTFTANLGKQRPVGLIGIPSHNLSRAATVRIEGCIESTFATLAYDSGTVSVWRREYPFGVLPWGHPSAFDGRRTPEDADGFNIGFVHVLDTDDEPTVVPAQYWRITITDTANAAGYVQFACPFIGCTWVISSAAGQGAKFRVRTRTTFTESDTGARYYRRRPGRRGWNVDIPLIHENEALCNAFEAFRTQGLDRHVYWVFDHEDTFHMTRRAHLCTFSDLPDFGHPVHRRNMVTIALDEAL